MQNKLKLYGVNNLTKALSFNIYDVCYAKTEREQRDYIKYIDQQYNSERLTGILERYDAYDINVYQSNLFHTRMLLKEIDLQNYLFNVDANELPPQTRLDISSSLRREMIEIFSGRNIY